MASFEHAEFAAEVQSKTTRPGSNSPQRELRRQHAGRSSNLPAGSGVGLGERTTATVDRSVLLGPTAARFGPKKSWTLQAFFDEWRPTSDHVYVWQHVQDSLRTKWRRSFEQIEYCSLPRGHVSRVINPNSSIRPGPPVIYHGGDAPIGFGELDEVRGVFNLSVTTPAVFDEVEQMIAGQPEKLSCQLKINLSPYNGAFAKKDSVSGFIGLQLAARQGQDWPSASQECCLDGARSRVSTLTLLSRTSFRDFG